MPRRLTVLLALASCQGPPSAGGEGTPTFDGEPDAAPVRSPPEVGLREDFWNVYGVVTSVVEEDGVVYVGGTFRYVGPETGSMVAIDTTTAGVSVPWGQVDGPVQAVASDGAGGWYVGGGFTFVGGWQRGRLAHIRATGELDRGFIADINGPVYAIAVAGGTVYIGGGFTRVGDQARSRLAAVDAMTGAVRDWDPGAGDELDRSHVYALAVRGDTVFVGGSFDSVAGQLRAGLAAVDAVTGAPTSWNPGGPGTEVLAMAAAGDTLYVGGWFTTVGGQPREKLAALDVQSGLATSWNPAADGPVNAIALGGDTVYVGGAFTTAGGQPREGIAAIDAATGLASEWNPAASGVVLALATDEDLVYASGQFDAIGGRARVNLAALDVTGAATDWSPEVGPWAVRALGVHAGTVYVGGDFISIGGRQRANLAAFDVATGAATDWNPDPDGPVATLHVDGGTVYAAGNFSWIGGEPRWKIAALDATTGAATDWNPGDLWGDVYAIAASDDAVYLGGAFSQVGGAARNNLAALERATGAPLDWVADPDAPVHALAVTERAILVGGTFSLIGTEPRESIAALDIATGAVTDWNPNPTVEPVGGPGVATLALAPDGETIYAAGSFSAMGGEPRSNLAALDLATGRATAWAPAATRGIVCQAVAADGVFTCGGGALVVLFDPTTGARDDWDPRIGGTKVLGMAVTGRTLVVGGTFHAVDTVPRRGIAAFDR